MGETPGVLAAPVILSLMVSLHIRVAADISNYHGGLSSLLTNQPVLDLLLDLVI